MSRNSSGNYTLPGGNPVVGGTTISTTWANETLGDLSSEITDSLSRSGKGAMLAPLKIANGTSAAPALTWDADPDSGIYRAGAGDVRMQVDATQTQRWTATGSTVPVPLTVTTGVANTAGVTATGNGTGTGLVGTGGATNGNGVSGTGIGTGEGVVGTGGSSSGNGGEFTGGGPNGYGLRAFGMGTGWGVEGIGGTSGTGIQGVGGIFSPGVAATSAVRRNAIVAFQGDLVFSGATNPNSNLSIGNTLTPMNIPKAWANITTTGLGSTAATVNAGFNVSGASVSGNTITLTLATAMANTNFAVHVTAGNPAICGSGASGSTTTVVIACKDLDGLVMPSPTTTGTPIVVPLFNFQTSSSRTLSVFVFGAQ